MSPTMVEEYARADRMHRHDTSHRVRTVARNLRAPLPAHLPPAFAPSMVDDLPEPARRWLVHAIEPGTLMFGAIEIQMSGEIKLGGWRPFTATQALVPDAGFVWAAHTTLGGFTVRGYDSYALGEGRMSWRMLGVIPLMSASGYDVTRSAADRLAAEAVLLPTSLVTATWRPGPDGDSATYLRHFGRRVARGRATITVAADGQLRSVSLLRWGAPHGGPFAEHLFEVTFGGEYLVDGIAVPDRWSAAWIDGGGRRQEFFRATIDTADCLLAGGVVMTLVHGTCATDVPAAPRPSARRLVAVGVRELPMDEAVLRWAATEALPGDAVHVVHAFVPLRLERCHWDPVRRERDHRALAARRAVAQAVQRTRTMRVDLDVDGSAVAGLPDDVLIEFSQVVNLLVVGDDSGDPPPNGHRVAWRVQDLAACPVVTVPRAGAQFHAPVTVVVDERGLVPQPLRFAIEWADRHGVNVRVCRSWSSLHDGPVSSTWLAHQAAELDIQLADWQQRYPHVGLTTSIETADDWPTRVAADSSLLVTAAGSHLSVVVAAAGVSPVCATAVVPV